MFRLPKSFNSSNSSRSSKSFKSLKAEEDPFKTYSTSELPFKNFKRWQHKFSFISLLLFILIILGFGYGIVVWFTHYSKSITGFGVISSIVMDFSEHIIARTILIFLTYMATGMSPIFIAHLIATLIFKYQKSLASYYISFAVINIVFIITFSLLTPIILSSTIFLIHIVGYVICFVILPVLLISLILSRISYYRIKKRYNRFYNNIQ